ncbi:class I SAM-dependent methyltransferase [Amycolatopsis pigmentata]|uniref:Class I SAM-dependent methyltransferase n=1 Tax=Amycolatopsis pigmentata TaxID=450801 RepID=A0ABW5G0G4_9PSEU
MRKVDELHAVTLAGIAERLTSGLPKNAVVVDVGSGTGGMSAAFASALDRRGGGKLLLVDAVPELLAVAAEAAGRQAGSSSVSIDTVRADIAEAKLHEMVPSAQLVWAAGMVHHLPDQQSGVESLVRALSGGGVLALAEGGLENHCLPWDLGVGEPGFERRLLAARDIWFREMRAAMPGVVRMPYGWNVALSRAGLVDVGSFSVPFDHPAPPTQAVRAYVLNRIQHLVETVGDRLTAEDVGVAERLLDPNDSEYIGQREDLYLLGTYTVHFGRLP